MLERLKKMKGFGVIAAFGAMSLAMLLQFSLASCGKSSTGSVEPQPGNGETPTENGKTGEWKGWMELPEIPEEDGYGFFTHNMSVNGVNTRDYSFCFSYSDYESIWVAYPLCNWNIGKKVGRSEQWGFDPLLPASEQQDIYYAYKKGSGKWYSRGHQIPSADRQGSFTNNSTTYYGTNITPQNGDFNGGTWANLEIKVRDWARRCDTLYVLTGCVLKGAKEYVLDSGGKKINVPKAYFKALLGYSKDGFDDGEHYIGSAFYYDHEEYSQESKSALKIQPEMAISISELENTLGYSLFTGLEAAAGKNSTKQIKSQDPQQEEWWWK